MNRNILISLLFITGILCGCYEKGEDDFIEPNVNIAQNEELITKTVSQNRWIYKEMVDKYLWSKSLPDSASLNFELSSELFFDKLLAQKDRFSWIERNVNYSGSSMFDKYGLLCMPYTNNQGKLINRVMQVVPGSIAFFSGLKRGDWITIGSCNDSFTIKRGYLTNGELNEIDGINFHESFVNINRGLSVSVDTILFYEGHNIGYMVYDQFEDSEGLVSSQYRKELRDVFSKFKKKGISDLIIDLRYNPGGYVSICQYLCGLVLADGYLGEVSGYHKFNDKLGKEYLEQTGNEEKVLTFPSRSLVGGKNLGIKKVYVIATNHSASASECFINSLKPFVEVVIVGTRTYGKGVGSWTIKDDDYKWQIQPITFRYYNAEHETVPDDGLTPDIYANELLADTLYELGDTREYLLKTTLNVIVTGNEKSAAVPVRQLTNIHPLIDNSFLEKRNVKGYIDRNH